MTVPYTFANATVSIPLSQLDSNFSALGNSNNVSYISTYIGGVSRNVTSKLTDIVNVKDFGCACDGVTDDGPTIVNAVINNPGITISFPANTTTMTSVALPFRNNVSYVCLTGFATIKAHPTSTDNVFGEANPPAGYQSNCLMFNLIVDGNKTNVSYNTRNSGVTDDAYQNCINLIRIKNSYFENVRTQNSVMNGWVVYDSSDNIFIDPWATDIGKSPDPVSGAFSYCGIQHVFGVNRNKFVRPYVNTTRQHGIWEGWDGADNYDNEYHFPWVNAATADGIKIAEDLGTYICHTPKIFNPTVLNCDVGIRISSQAAAGEVIDPVIVNPTIQNNQYGIVVNNFVTRLKISTPTVISNTNTGILIGANVVDAQVIGGYSLSNGTNYTDSGTRTVFSSFVIDTTGGISLGLGSTTMTQLNSETIYVNGSTYPSFFVTRSSGNTAGLQIDQSGVAAWQLNCQATTGTFAISQGGSDWISSLITTGETNLAGNKIKFSGIGTTASAANAFLDNTAANNLLRSTSSLVYKKDVEFIEPEIVKKVADNISGIWFRSLCEADPKEWSWYGFAAEEVAKLDPRLVEWSKRIINYETKIEEIDEPVFIEQDVEFIELINNQATLLKRKEKKQLMELMPLFDELGNPVIKNGQQVMVNIAKTKKIKKETKVPIYGDLVPEAVRYPTLVVFALERLNQIIKQLKEKNII